MIHRISQKITDFLIFRGIVEKTDADIYIYGYETLISGIIDFILTMAIGFLLKCPLNAFIFFVMFVSVRMYTGGYHAATYVRCKLTMILILLAVLGLSFVELPFSAISLLMVLLNITVFFKHHLKIRINHLMIWKRRNITELALLFLHCGELLQ